MMAVSAAIFAVLQSSLMDPFVEEIIIATGFFVSIVALARFYFWPKIYLLLQGADLDKNFQIVFPKKVDKDDDDTGGSISASTRAANAHASAANGGNAATGITEKDAELLKKYLPRLPKTMDDCRILMEHLAKHNMVF